MDRLEALYRRFRKGGSGLVGRDAEMCKRYAETLLEWEEAEEAGLVRLNVEPDYDHDWRECDKGFEDDGAWGVVGQYLENGKWITADSIWGCVGYRNVASPFENEYVIGIMRETLDQLATHNAQTARQL